MFGHDYLEGGDGTDFLYGMAGEDRLVRGNGDDYLYGGEGNDYLVGGEGVDHFIFDLYPNLHGGRDDVMDFEEGADRILIRGGPASMADLKFEVLGNNENSSPKLQITYAEADLYGENVIILDGYSEAPGVDSFSFLA